MNMLYDSEAFAVVHILADAPADNVFMVKVAYWFNR